MNKRGLINLYDAIMVVMLFVIMLSVFVAGFQNFDQPPEIYEPEVIGASAQAYGRFALLSRLSLAFKISELEMSIGPDMFRLPCGEEYGDPVIDKAGKQCYTEAFDTIIKALSVDQYLESYYHGSYVLEFRDRGGMKVEMQSVKPYAKYLMYQGESLGERFTSTEISLPLGQKADSYIRNLSTLKQQFEEHRNTCVLANSGTAVDVMRACTIPEQWDVVLRNPRREAGQVRVDLIMKHVPTQMTYVREGLVHSGIEIPVEPRIQIEDGATVKPYSYWQQKLPFDIVHKEIFAEISSGEYDNFGYKELISALGSNPEIAALLDRYAIDFDIERIDENKVRFSYRNMDTGSWQKAIFDMDTGSLEVTVPVHVYGYDEADDQELIGAGEGDIGNDIDIPGSVYPEYDQQLLYVTTYPDLPDSIRGLHDPVVDEIARGGIVLAPGQTQELHTYAMPIRVRFLGYEGPSERYTVMYYPQDMNRRYEIEVVVSHGTIIDRGDHSSIPIYQE